MTSKDRGRQKNRHTIKQGHIAKNERKLKPGHVTMSNLH